MGCPVTEPRRGLAAEIFNSTCERRVLGLRARKDTRTTRGFRISTREVTSFTYRTTVSNFLLPLYTVTGSFLSSDTEKSEKSSDSRIHHPTGHTNPAMGNLVFGHAERPGNSIGAAKIPDTVE